MKKSLLLFSILLTLPVHAQERGLIDLLSTGKNYGPLEKAEVICRKTGMLSVSDASGRVYFRAAAREKVTFVTGGSSGIQKVILTDKKGKILDSTSFRVSAETHIDDRSIAGDMFRLFHDGMLVYAPSGYEQVTWKGKTYHYFVNWVLDNNNTMKGMQYFSPYSRDLVDLLRENQEPNGMIWSFVNSGINDYHYYETAYTPIQYFKRDSNVWFVRQPVENHVEYNYVNMMYQHWKASGDNAWMKGNLDCATRALDYSVTDTVRWSKRFGLLKRPYTIDSWDFQVDDEYTPYAPISPTMVIVPGKTKFGIYFGDNTGYVEACNQLAEMLHIAGQESRARIYRDRADSILARLNALSWNGHYYRHFIDEDPSVVRHLGVDEKSQIAQGNMYSINRGIGQEKNVAIINTYLELRKRLPPGSPGEWYAIYPPFGKGFGQHNEIWQYMNGGVAGHAAGELARGAYENGYEEYASGILKKLYQLGKENGNRVWFAFTGSIPARPALPDYRQLSLSAQVNMDLWDQGSATSKPWMSTTRPGNDMRGLPVGKQVFHDIPFQVIDPAINQRRAVIGISTLPGYPRQVEVPVGDTARTLYLLHSSSDNIPSNVAGSITFRYADGTESSQYLMKGREVTNWWFSSLENDRAGVAWWGPNLCSTKVGVCWAAISNPYPSKKIDRLVFGAPLEGGIYALIAVTLADREHYVRPKTESFGGPDNWAAACAMAALVEGLAGVKNVGLAYDRISLSPRWLSAGVDSVGVTVQLAASKGYVSYHYLHDAGNKKILLEVTGSGNALHAHVLLPSSVTGISSVTIDGKPVQYASSQTGNSQYADFDVTLPQVSSIEIRYN